MITTIFINIFVAFAGLIISFLSLFGTATLPTGITQNMTAFASMYSTINSVFPVDTILIIIGIQTAIELTIFTYRSIKWGYQKIPGIT